MSKKILEAPMRIKSGTVERHEEMLAMFEDMLEAWKYRKDGRDYELKDNKEELVVEITAKSLN